MPLACALCLPNPVQTWESTWFFPVRGFNSIYLIRIIDIHFAQNWNKRKAAGSWPTPKLVTRQAENSSRSLIYPPAIIPFLILILACLRSFLFYYYFPAVYFFLFYTHSLSIESLFCYFIVFWFSITPLGWAHPIWFRDPHLSLSFLKYFVSRFPEPVFPYSTRRHSFFVYTVSILNIPFTPY